MYRTMMVALAMIGMTACGGSAGAVEAAAKAAKAEATAKVSLTLDSGTQIEATTQRTISSLGDKDGATFTAKVSSDVKGDGGKVLIPSGSTLHLVITKIEAATDRSAKDGKLTVAVSSVTVGNETYPIDAVITSMAHTLKGVGVGDTEVQKTAGGAVLGAIVGKVVGGDQRGVIIGAVVGGAAGAVVARETANREVVVVSGTSIVVKLNSPVTLDGK